MLTPRKIFAFVIYSLLIAGVLGYKDYRERNQFRFVIDMGASRLGVSQVYFDLGNGYRERDSHAIQIQRGELQKYTFPLPRRAIKALRFDPINVSAVVRVRDARIENKQGKIIKAFSIQDFRPIHQISGMESSEGVLIIHTTESANDPITHIDNSSFDYRVGWRDYVSQRGGMIVALSLGSLLLLIGLNYLVFFAGRNQHIVEGLRRLEQLPVAAKANDLRVVTMLVVLLATLCVATGFNMYSLAGWHSFLDGSKAQEIMVGQPRAIRADDWVLDLPLALSQLKSPQPFSSVNPNIGTGQQMFVPFKTPSYAAVTLFRPSVWGFFLGADTGIAWMWTFMALGLFYSSFLLLRVITEDAYLTFWGSIVVTTSPYFLAWNFHVVEPVIHGFFVFVALTLLMRGQTGWRRALISLFLGWSLTCAILNYLYPARIIVVAYLILFLLMGWILEKSRWQEVQWRSFAKSLIPALVVFGLGMATVAWEAWPWIQAIQGTAYPGQRISTGGGLQLWQFFAEHYMVPLFKWRHTDWGVLGNQCEAASFYLFFPLIGAIVAAGIIPQAWQRVSAKQLLSEYGLQIALLLLIGGLLFYVLWGIPVALAKMTLLSMTLSNRVIIGIGLASLIMLIAFLREGPLPAISKRTKALLIVGWLLISGLGLMSVVGNVGPIPRRLILLTLPLQIFLAYLVVEKKRMILPIIFLLQAPYLFVNPWTRGGTDYLYSNPIAQEILALQANEESPARWIALTPRNENPDRAWDITRTWALSNYFRMIGVPALGGLNCPPQKEVFEPLFADDIVERAKLDQCAFFTFELAAEGQPPKVKMVGFGNLVVQLTKKQLKDLSGKYNVRFVLVVSDEGSVEKMGLEPAFKEVGRSTDIHYFRAAR